MAYDFNGTSDNMEIASAILDATPLSIFARFVTDTTAAGTAVIASLTGSTGAHQFRMSRNGQDLEAVAVEGATVTAASIPLVLLTNSQYAATAVFSSSTSRSLYLGDVNFDDDTVAVTPTSIDRTNIGARYNSGSLGLYFDGRICEVAFWNAALTQEEHRQMWRGLPPILVRPSSLVAYFPLVRDANDIKASRAFTINGATVSPHFSVRHAPRRRATI